METIATINHIATEFFSTLGVNFSNLTVTAQDVDSHIYMVRIESSDSPLLIGPQGRTLDETQSLLIQMCEKSLQTHCLIHLEINDYLAEKQRRLYDIVDRKVELARRNGIDQVIYELSGYERKQVHAYIGDTHTDIQTVSIDGDKGRELHIRLREGIAPTSVPPVTHQPPRVSKNADIVDDLSRIDLDGTNI